MLAAVTEAPPETLKPPAERSPLALPAGLRWRYAWTILRRHFRRNQLLLRTAALTYATLLSSVPSLAILLSLLRAFGVEGRVLPFLIQRLRIGGDQPVEVILGTVERLDPAALGAFGVIGLLGASLLLLAQVDGAFNAIWGVRENRSLAARLLGYGGLLILGPLWIALWTSAVSSLKLALAAWPGDVSILLTTLPRLAGTLLVFVVLTALIRVTPNTRVRFLPAAGGAAIATGLLEISQALFVGWVKTSVAYDIVYGAFAALPVFLAWIYLNWLVVLLGVEASYLLQHLPTWLREAGEPHALTWEEREQLALASAALLAEADKPLAVETLGDGLEVSGRLVQHALDDLEDLDLVRALSSDREGQVVAYEARPALQELSLAKLRRDLRRLREPATPADLPAHLRPPPGWVRLLEPWEKASDAAYGEWTTLELARAMRGRNAGGGKAEAPDRGGGG
jgi:membrane protein